MRDPKGQTEVTHRSGRTLTPADREGCELEIAPPSQLVEEPSGVSGDPGVSCDDWRRIEGDAHAPLASLRSHVAVHVCVDLCASAPREVRGAVERALGSLGPHRLAFEELRHGGRHGSDVAVRNQRSAAANYL